MSGAKGLSPVEVKLIGDFSNIVAARQFSEQVKISKLTLSYDAVGGYVIQLVEEPVVANVPEAMPTAEA